MTILEFILLTFLWFILGIFISYKQNWYKSNKPNQIDSDYKILFNVIFAPFIAFVIIIKQFFIQDWKN